MDGSFHIQKLNTKLKFLLDSFNRVLRMLSAIVDNSKKKNAANEVLNTLFMSINLSILAGEYAEDLDLVKKEIASAKDNLSGLLTASEQTISDPLLLGLLYNAITIIENSLNSYRLLIHRTEQITHPNTKSSFIYEEDNFNDIGNQSNSLINKHKKNIYKDFDSEKTLKAYNVLITNIHIALLDLSCKPDELTFHRLEFIEKFLTELYADPALQPFEFIFLIIQKAKFLKLKILVRFFQEQKELGSDLVVVKNSTIKTLESLIEELEFEELRSFLKYSFYHYIENEQNEILIKGNFKRLKGANDSYYKRHLDIKYYKDIKPSKAQLESIAELFDNEIFVETDHFNKYANNVCSNYANNNLFSFQLEYNKKISYDEVLECYKRVKDVRNSTKINNYFPELRFLKYLIEKLSYLLDNNLPTDEFDLVNVYLRKCNDLISVYKKNINWTKYNHSYIYQLPFPECLIKNESVKKAKLRQLFIASSMILPLNINKNYEELSDYNNQIKVYNSIRNTINNLKVQSKKLDIEIELNDKKEIKFIEILGLFCAISTFVSASILAFMGNQLDSKILSLSNKTERPYSNGLQDSTVFLLSTGTILCAFIGLLIFVFNKKNISKRATIVIVIMLILLIATCNNIKN